MSEFKVGDKVICIDNYDLKDELELNKIYSVLECKINYYRKFIVIINEHGIEANYFEFRFRKAPETKNEENKSEAKKGLRYNSNKLRWRNFPMFLMEPLVEVGAKAELWEGNPNGKYPTYNFLSGLSVSDNLDALKRHLMKFESPYHPDLDEETKVNHLAHIAWNALVALHVLKTRPELDDRYKIETKESNDSN